MRMTYWHDLLQWTGFAWLLLKSNHCRVERGAESQVQEDAFNSRRQRQCGQHHRLYVSRRSRWRRRHAQATDADRPSTAMPQSSNPTSHVRASAGFYPAVHGHQGGVTSPVVGWPHWQVHRPIRDQSAARDICQRTYRFWYLSETYLLLVNVLQ